MKDDEARDPSDGVTVSTFAGSARSRPLGFGFSFGGKLVVDENHVAIKGPGRLLDVRRNEVRAIVLSRRPLGNHVSVRLLDGSLADLSFAARSLRKVRAALVDHGWPIEGEEPRS